MAYEIPGFLFPLPAGQDFRTGAGQFRFLDINATGKVVAPALGGKVVGVRQNKPNLNEATTIMHSGITFLEAGAAVAQGAEITCDAAGAVVAAGVGNRVHGIALEAASGAGIQIAVLLDVNGRTA